MILCRKRKFIVLGIPKTGSTSIMNHLLKEIPDEIDICTGRDSLNEREMKDVFETTFSNHPKIHPVLGPHPTLKEFIYYKFLNENELSDMNVYAVMREPVDRFISIAHFLIARENQISISNMSNNLVVEKCLKYFGKSSFLAPQSNWILFNKKPINKILKYPNFSQMFQEIGVDDNLNFRHLSHFRTDKSIDLDSSLRKEILDIYRIDAMLWNSL